MTEDKTAKILLNMEMIIRRLKPSLIYIRDEDRNFQVCVISPSEESHDY